MLYIHLIHIGKQKEKKRNRVRSHSRKTEKGKDITYLLGGRFVLLDPGSDYVEETGVRREE